MPVFMPSAPAVVSRWAASPARNTAAAWAHLGSSANLSACAQSLWCGDGAVALGLGDCEITQLILGHRKAVGCGRARDGIRRPDISGIDNSPAGLGYPGRGVNQVHHVPERLPRRTVTLTRTR